MGILGKLFGRQEYAPKTSLSVTANKMTSASPIMSVHPDFKDYIWIGDGKYKNYYPAQKEVSSISVHGVKITFSFGIDEEPSLIYTGLPVAFDNGPDERPPYYPVYKNLTPEQKGVYWKFLSNPYDSTVDIGYVFILYYGLERFLLTNKYERVIDLIISLRDVHTNKSFQYYTANAIILSCLHYQRPDIVMRFMDSLDKEHESEFSDDLFLLCKHELNLPLSAKEIMRMAKSVDFKKGTYIKQHPDLFVSALTDIMRKRYGSDEVLCNNFISEQEFKALPTSQLQVFANVSIHNKTVSVPVMTSGKGFRNAFYELLDDAHESVKAQLVEMRKYGNAKVEVVKKTPAKDKKPLVFDMDKEGELLKSYSSKPQNSLDQHFASIDLQNFYYGFRNIGSKYLDKCIDYCLDDISRLPVIQSTYQKNNMCVFNGRIPAFERLAIIYEKQKDYLKAIDICDQAIQYYKPLGMKEHVEDFTNRRQKLIEKSNKNK